jgi:hypothetical protein
MKEGDLVIFSTKAHPLRIDSEKVGLVIEIQSRGPVPGAYVLWPNDDNALWTKIENLLNINAVVSQ